MQPEQPKQQPQLPPFYAETMLLRRVASHPDLWVRWQKHAEERMAQVGRVADDILMAMTNCQVFRVDVQEDVVFRFRGENIDGEEVEAAAAVLNHTTIKVVTVIS